MARELSTPLTQEDLVFLRQRYPESTVQRQMELRGVADTTDEVAEDDESGAGAPEEGSGEPEATDDGSEGGEDSEDAEDDDLIGDAELYDPLAHTTNEVRDYLKTASEDERSRVKAVEQERTDREPRTSILNYNPS